MPGTMNSRIESLRCGRAADAFTARGVVVDAVPRRDQRIAPAVIHQQLAAAAEERLQIRIDRVVVAVVQRVGQRDVLVEVERLEVPVGILEHDELEVVGRDARAARARRPRPAHPSSLPGSRPGKITAPVRRILSGRVDLPRGLHLRRRQARRRCRRRALDHLRIEVAACRIVDDAVLDAVERVAGVERRLVDRRVLLRRDVAGRIRQRGLRDPEALRPACASCSWPARRR